MSHCLSVLHISCISPFHSILVNISLCNLFIYIIIYFSTPATHESSRSVVIIARTGDGRRIPPPCETIPLLVAVLVLVTRALARSNLNVHLLTDIATTCRVQSGAAAGEVAYLLIVTSFSLGSVNILDLLLFIALRSSLLCSK